MLHDLFPGVPATRLLAGDLQPAEMQLPIAAKLAHHLGLGFTPPAVDRPPNLCLANEEEVQTIYRSSLTATEIFYYVLDCIEFPESTSDRVPYPSTATRFWARAKRGRHRFKPGDSGC